MKELQLVFLTSLGKRVTYAIPDPRESMTEEEVVDVMQEIIATNAFLIDGGTLTEALEAKVVARDTSIVYAR
ncbi:DUF2922 domain-containing protein [Savagea sp. SN6]|uniref:DUF2922 domain-containing protein n=1 Tax=Savagea serpentis TaxID=2785297 RepID=A0A8J7G173_9BACL|nr:DUF2922 domain-containing protein [Savagea serpentis]MBF4499802.1 DUF2922 domain-containing protein [Savagea serpentis]